MIKKTLELKSSDFKDLSDSIRNIKKLLEESQANIISALADYTQKEIEANIKDSIYEDGAEDLETFKEKRGEKIVVGMRGTQAIYDEFGTGTFGFQFPHPIKNEFPLNAYNSGKTIRPATKEIAGIAPGDLYWTYKTESGEIRYTQGIPAGRQVYDASISLKEAKKDIIKKEVGDLLSKL